MPLCRSCTTHIRELLINFALKTRTKCEFYILHQQQWKERKKDRTTADWCSKVPNGKVLQKLHEYNRMGWQPRMKAKQMCFMFMKKKKKERKKIGMRNTQMVFYRRHSIIRCKWMHVIFLNFEMCSKTKTGTYVTSPEKGWTLNTFATVYILLWMHHLD